MSSLILIQQSIGQFLYGNPLFHPIHQNKYFFYELRSIYLYWKKLGSFALNAIHISTMHFNKRTLNKRLQLTNISDFLRVLHMHDCIIIKLWLIMALDLLLCLHNCIIEEFQNKFYKTWIVINIIVFYLIPNLWQEHVADFLYVYISCF